MRQPNDTPTAVHVPERKHSDAPVLSGPRKRAAIPGMEEGARRQTYHSHTPRSKTRQNAAIILVCSLLIVAAMVYAWGQTIQHERAEAAHSEVIAND